MENKLYFFFLHGRDSGSPDIPLSQHWHTLSRVQHFVTPWTVACQTPPSMEFSRQEYWSGLSCPPSTDLPNPGIEPRSPVLQADSLLSEPPGKPSIGILMLDSRRGADRSDALEVRSSGWSGEAFCHLHSAAGGMRAARTCFSHPPPPPQHQCYWESCCLRQAFPEEGEGLQGAEQGASIRWNTSLGEVSAVSSSSFHTYKWKEREGRFHPPPSGPQSGSRA